MKTQSETSTVRWRRITDRCNGKRGKFCRLYRIWSTARIRCHNKNRDDWPRYGGRGITFAAEWNDYATFRAWAIANGYSKDMTLDRKNNDGPYSPENCRWVTKADQQLNTRASIMLTLNGRTQSICAWARELPLTTDQIRQRVYQGWPDERILSEPIDKRFSKRRIA